MAAESAAGSMGAAGIMAGGQALSGLVQAMYQQEIERRKRMQEAQQNQINLAGDYGRNQQDMLAQMANHYKTALGV